MLEVLGYFSAARAGCRGVVVPGQVGAEVAFPRPPLVEATRVKLGEAHKWMGLQPGALGVSCRIRGSLLPLLHEELLAEELKLRVGAAQEGGVGNVSLSRCWEVTGRGAWPSGPRRKSIEWGRASRGRWALFFEGGLGWSHGSGRRLPAFLPERSL